MIRKVFEIDLLIFCGEKDWKEEHKEIIKIDGRGKPVRI